MISYNVMLEGEEDDGTEYFITLEVASSSQAQAEGLALNDAVKMGLNIIGVEEVEVGQQLKPSTKPKVLKVYGKSYFTNEE